MEFYKCLVANCYTHSNMSQYELKSYNTGRTNKDINLIDNDLLAFRAPLV